MKKISFLYILFCIISLTSCREDTTGTGDGRQQHVLTYKVAVIMPASQQERWERTAQWALENLEEAQDTFSTKVRLELEWFDEEDEENLADFARRVDADPQYKAIIGPMKTRNAYIVGRICENHHTTLLLPQCTSVEVQRFFAESPNVFNLTQSDIGQIEVMVSCALARKAKSISLLTHYGNPADSASILSYGSTFHDWVGFLASEAGLDIDTICTYTDVQSLHEAVFGLSNLYADARYDSINSVLLFAPESPGEMLLFDAYAGSMFARAGHGRNRPFTICSDASVGDIVEQNIGKYSEYEGIDIAASANSGFVPAYQARFKGDDEPIDGEPQLFDALYMLTFALTIDSNDLNQAIVTLVSSNSDYVFSWLPDDTRFFLSQAVKGIISNPAGVIGEWTFDERYHSAVLTTTYRHWHLLNGSYSTIEYITLGHSGRAVSSQQIWQMNANANEYFDQEQDDLLYGELRDHYAVIVAASTGWANYRHQSDALDVYQMLRHYGYDDDHIILIMEDDIAADYRNITSGEMRVEPNGPNLYENVTVDYKPSALTEQDIYNIMNGQRSQRTPAVLGSGAEDNVFWFWSGHGNDGILYFDRKTIYDTQIKDILSEMNRQNKFRKLFFVIETCRAGSIAKPSVGIPGVLFLTAANDRESSLADIMHPQMGVWMSNAFTRAFRTAIDNNPSISMRDLYYEVARQTVGSHATMYNMEYYGNMFDNTFYEYLPPGQDAKKQQFDCARP